MHKIPLLAVLLLAGCKTTNDVPLLQVDPQLLTASESFSIIEKDAFWHEDKLNLAIGPYRIEHMDIGWRSGSSTDTNLSGDGPGYRSQDSNEQQSLSYQFLGSHGAWQNRCTQRFNQAEQGLSFASGLSQWVIPLKFTASYSFQCQFGAQDNPWQLLIMGDNRGKTDYQLYDQKGQKYQVIASHLDLMPLPDRSFIGFQIADDTGIIAAVSLARPGKLWLTNKLEPASQALLAQAATNLWLFQYAFEQANKAN
jgi:hypothetical protein